MKTLGCVLAIALASWVAPTHAQCWGQRTYYGRPVYSGVRSGGPVYYGGAYSAGYAPYGVNSPFNARRPSYPLSSSAAIAPRYGAQTTYFRAPAGTYAQPGGTFFGGYDYQVTYPVDWYAGNWTWW